MTDQPMTFIEHLGELRVRMVRIAMALLLGFLVAYGFKDELFQLVAAPMQHALASAGIYTFRAIEITETIFVYLKLSIVAGIFVTLPFTFYQLWAFVAPGLHEQEKSAIAPLIFFSTLFFMLGAFFAYKVIIPFISDYLAELTLANAAIQMDVTVKSAFGFSLLMLLSFGLAFELPLIMFFLSLMGVMNAARYMKLFRYFVVVSFVVGALLTPPDPISQLLMAVPLNVLYLLGVLASYFADKSNKEGKKSQRISSRVWAVLAVSLLLIGSILGFGSWWLGRTNSPLQWIPADAQWIVSVHRSALLGPNAPPERIDRLTKRLSLPTAAGSADKIIFAGGPDNKTAFVAVGACADNTPEEGQCHGDDWVSGDVDWLKQVESDKSAATVVKIAALETRAPGWLWSSKPPIEYLKLLPGYDESAPKVKSIIITTQLHGDNPGATLEFETLDEATAGILQSRIDLWRAERARQQEQDERDLVSAKDQMQVISLITESLALSTQQWDLATKDARADVLKHQVQKRRKALEARLNKHKTLLNKQLSTPTEEAHNILDKVGKDGIKTWQSEIKKGGIKLNVEVLDPKGVDQLVRIFN